MVLAVVFFCRCPLLGLRSSFLVLVYWGWIYFDDHMNFILYSTDMYFNVVCLSWTYLPSDLSLPLPLLCSLLCRSWHLQPVIPKLTYILLPSWFSRLVAPAGDNNPGEWSSRSPFCSISGGFSLHGYIFSTAPAPLRLAHHGFRSYWMQHLDSSNTIIFLCPFRLEVGVNSSCC